MAKDLARLNRREGCIRRLDEGPRPVSPDLYPQMQFELEVELPSRLSHLGQISDLTYGMEDDSRAT